MCNWTQTYAALHLPRGVDSVDTRNISFAPRVHLIMPILITPFYACTGYTSSALS